MQSISHTLSFTPHTPHTKPCSRREAPKVCYIIPPHITDKLKQTDDPHLLAHCDRCHNHDEEFRQYRRRHDAPRALFSETKKTDPVIRVYDCKNTETLPGSFVEDKEGASCDVSVNEAYRGAKLTQQVYLEKFHRKSIDDNNMDIVSSVHFDRDYNNAFWNGEQMVYGDGDKKIFNSFTIAPDVIGHELSHGVVQHECDFEYKDQSGALNESFADCFGSIIKQFQLKQTAIEADWLIGEGIVIGAKALRSMSAPGTAYKNHPYIGDDPQPGKMSDFVNTTQDEGGVHINSGIPNHAFYLAAVTIGGYTFEKTGQIWYEALKKSKSHDDFLTFANQTIAAAEKQFGKGSREESAVIAAWKTVEVLK